MQRNGLEVCLKENAENLTSLKDSVEEHAGEIKLDGAQYKNVYGSYVHSIFDKEQVAERIIEAII